MDVTTGKFKKNEGITSSHESILDALTEACRPARKATRCMEENGLNDIASCSTKREDAPRLSLFEQVINCTLLSNPEEDSDDETYKTRTYEDDNDTDGQNMDSFETMSDDDFDKKKRGRSRRHNR